MTVKRLFTMTVTVVLANLLISANAYSTPIAIGVGVFGPDSTWQHFSASGLKPGPLPDGYTLGGITYDFSLGNQYLSGRYSGVVLSPVIAPFIVGQRTDGILTMQLSSPVNRFGFDYELSFASVVDAATVSIFNGTTPLGSLSYRGTLLQSFSLVGGFAGIESAEAFDRVEVGFQGFQFQIDNIRTETVSVSETPTFMLLFAGLTAALTFKLAAKTLGRSCC